MTISRRLVRLAEEQLSSNEQAACATAAAVVALWQQCHEFGQLFMSYLYMACPPLLPSIESVNEEVDENKMRIYVSDFIYINPTCF